MAVWTFSTCPNCPNSRLERVHPMSLFQIIFTMDEVNFVQNMVYYVERAYRIPDFGMWERGSRDNVGRRELHAR